MGKVTFIPVSVGDIPLYPITNAEFDISDKRKVDWVVKNGCWLVWDSPQAMKEDLDSTEHFTSEEMLAHNTDEKNLKWKFESYEVYVNPKDPTSGTVIIRYSSGNDEPMFLMRIKVPEDLDLPCSEEVNLVSS